MSATARRRVGPWALVPVVTLLVALLAALVPAATGYAVAHGRRVSHPERAVPWVVSIMQSPTSADAQPDDLVCSGSALDPRTVLTAAHCVEDLGADALTVGYAAATLAGQVRVGVSGFQIHPGYDSWEVVNDLAVLRTSAPMAIATFPTLPTGRQATRARASSARFTIYGWGDVSRSGTLTGNLNKARMANRNRQAKRVWGSDFSARRQVAAGALPRRTKAYPGACPGDSGGPLVMTVRKAPVVVGVTSYGVKRCGAASPTIFTAVGHYAPWVRAAAAELAATEQPGAVTPAPSEGTPLPADPDLATGLP